MRERLHGDQTRHESDIRLIDAWRSLRMHWRLFSSIVFAFAVASVIFALTMTPVFRAETSIVLIEDSGAAGRSALLAQFGGLAGLAGVNLAGLAGGTNTAAVMLNSRTLIQEFIQRENLLPVLFDQTDQPSDRQTLWRAVKHFQQLYDVNEDVQTGLITVRIEWTDPQVAASWANQLVDLANELLRQRDLADAQRNIGYLKKQLAQTNVVELQQVIYSLIETEMKTLMLANARDEYAFKVIDEAVVPEVRERPKRKQLVILGTLLGCIVATFVVAMLRMFHKLREREAALAEHKS